MAISHNTGNPLRWEFWRRLSGRVSRYDLVLAAIPLIFALALSVYALTSISLKTALAGGAILSGVCFVDAVYLNPPVDTLSDS
jgi:hypothetical protein